jgi:peptidyl-tRNA hydrolase
MKCSIIIRKDLKMSHGKIISQVSHAIVNMVRNTNKKNLKKWIKNGEKIVSLKINSKQELLALHKKALENNIYSNIVMDAGLTQIESDITVCIIGPDNDNIIDTITKDLKLF